MVDVSREKGSSADAIFTTLRERAYEMSPPTRRPQRWRARLLCRRGSVPGVLEGVVVVAHPSVSASVVRKSVRSPLMYSEPSIQATHGYAEYSTGVAACRGEAKGMKPTKLVAAPDRACKVPSLARAARLDAGSVAAYPWCSAHIRRGDGDANGLAASWAAVHRRPLAAG